MNYNKLIIENNILFRSETSSEASVEPRDRYIFSIQNVEAKILTPLIKTGKKTRCSMRKRTAFDIPYKLMTFHVERH